MSFLPKPPFRNLTVATSINSRASPRLRIRHRCVCSSMANNDSINVTALQQNRVELVNRGHHGPPISIPILGLGVYLMSPEEAYKAVSFAVDYGYRHIDSAHLYDNERAVGNAIRSSGIPREEIFVTTKLWDTDQGYSTTLNAFDRSLKELGLDYVDLYLVHSPLAVRKRLDTWKAMETILKSGKAKSIGVSNYGVHHLKELFGNCAIRPSINQIELHPFNQRKDIVEFCEQENIVVEAYSPLTRGKRLKDRTLVKGYTDFDSAGDPDTRRFHGGYLFTLGTASISWSSCKQETMAASTAEAEYRALFDGTIEAIYLRSLLAALHFPCVSPTIVYCDNQSAIALAGNPIITPRIRHVEVHFHFSREQVELGTIHLEFVPSSDNFADMLTKAVNWPVLQYLLPRIGLGTPSPTSSA